MTAKEIRQEIRDIRRHMRENGIRRSSCFNGGHDAESYRCNARLYELGVWLKDTKKEPMLTGDAAIVAKMVRDMSCGDISVGGCRGCGSQGGFGLAEYEMQSGKPRVELCFLCDQCKERLGGLRIKFRLAYHPVWGSDA